MFGWSSRSRAGDCSPKIPDVDPVSLIVSPATILFLCSSQYEQKTYFYILYSLYVKHFLRKKFLLITNLLILQYYMNCIGLKADFV